MAAKPAPVVNEREIRVIGMSRSGNHAILEWLLGGAGGDWLFLNCAEPKRNPFTTARPLTPQGPRHLSSYATDPGREADDPVRKDLLVHSYEDVFLGSVGDPEWEAEHDDLVGRSGKRLDLLILRDPFNLFASRIRSGIGVKPTIPTGQAAGPICGSSACR